MVRIRRSSSIDLGRHRVELDPEAGGRFVHQIDRLVGEKPVAHIPVGEGRSRDEGGILDPDSVMDLVTLLQAPQDRDRVLDRRLPHEDRLETSFERGVLLDVLAVLVEGRRPHAPQVPAREGRLQEVGGVDRALRGPRTHQGVQLVDEEDHVPFRLLHLPQERLQPFLELAAELGPRDEGAEVE